MTRVFLLLIILTASIFAQSGYNEIYTREFYRAKFPQRLPLLFRTYPLYQGEGVFRVHIFVELQYKYLQFIRHDGQYKAGAEIEVVFRNKKSRETFSQIWQMKTETNQFAATLDRYRYIFTADSIDLVPGKYDLEFKHTDLNGQQRISFRQELTLPKVKNHYASPPLFFHPSEKPGTPIANMDGIPSPLQKHWNFNSSLGIYLRVWHKDAGTDVSAKVEFKQQKQKGEIVFSEEIAANGGSHSLAIQTIIPLSKLEEGKHQLKVVYKIGKDSDDDKVGLEVLWFDKPLSLWTEDLAIGPLEYIMDEKDFQHINSGSPDDKFRKMSEFWKKQDPTPGTPYNELMSEFYSRVDSSIAKFGEGRKMGWETDLGKIYISNGPPHKIEDHSLDPVAHPVLRWIYYTEDSQYVYVFRALDGRKRYKLEKTEESSL